MSRIELYCRGVIASGLSPEILAGLAVGDEIVIMRNFPDDGTYRVRGRTVYSTSSTPWVRLWLEKVS